LFKEDIRTNVCVKFVFKRFDRNESCTPRSIHGTARLHAKQGVDVRKTENAMVVTGVESAILPGRRTGKPSRIAPRNESSAHRRRQGDHLHAFRHVGVGDRNANTDTKLEVMHDASVTRHNVTISTNHFVTNIPKRYNAHADTIISPKRAKAARWARSWPTHINGPHIVLLERIPEGRQKGARGQHKRVKGDPAWFFENALVRDDFGKAILDRPRRHEDKIVNFR